ncbi:hypothetical protein [Henriciella litoralis]|uniref:hypothetical protein n=1 Tax=Henriciella litoralis TaxID=568102 RepID=UPI00111BF663|nr:hypothetical protein [Henriciella litoralis]
MTTLPDFTKVDLGTLKGAGAQRVFIAGKTEAPYVDTPIFMGCNAVEVLELAQAELGVAKG